MRGGAVVYDGPSEARTPDFLRELDGASVEELYGKPTTSRSAESAAPGLPTPTALA
jgi:hypothetical protein